MNKYKVQIKYKRGVTPYPFIFDIKKPSKILKMLYKEFKISQIKIEDLASIHIERI